jgi:hypothetical protein
LVQQGYAPDPFAMPTPAKASPVPEVALIRGRQKLEVELLVAD